MPAPFGLNRICFLIYVPLAQSVEHLTFNQRVEGSSPSWHTIFILYAGVAELADALDLGSSVFDVGVRVPSPASYVAEVVQW